jgi:signal transduction histidine kinase
VPFNESKWKSLFVKILLKLFVSKIRKTSKSASVDGQNGTKKRLFDMNSKSNAPIDREYLIADLAHALRSPLGVIFNHVEPLLLGLDGDLTDVVKKDVQVIADGAYAVSAAVGKLLAWIEIEAARLTQTPITIAPLIQQVIYETHASAERAGIQVISSIADKTIQVSADERALYQIVSALLTYFIENGAGTRLNVVLSTDDEAVSIRFSCDGEAIPVASSSSRKNNASIDLLMSSILMERMGGFLVMDTDADSREAFSLVFPLNSKATDSIS